MWTLPLIGSVHEAVISYVPETEAETSIIPVATLIESPLGVDAKESGLYLRANISYSCSTSDCVKSTLNNLIGPNSPSNIEELVALFWVVWSLPKNTSPLSFNTPLTVPVTVLVKAPSK